MLCSEFIVSYGPRMHHVMLKVYCALLAENVSCSEFIGSIAPECVMLCLKIIVRCGPRMCQVILRFLRALWARNVL